MPALKRVKTKYPGVTYVEVPSPTTGIEKVYYIRYRKSGRLIEEPVGRHYRDRMNPLKASRIRGRRLQGEDLPNRERREQERQARDAEANRMTIDRLWELYREAKPQLKAVRGEMRRYEKHLRGQFGNREPRELLPIDIDRLRIGLLKKCAPQTVKNVLSLLRLIINFGVKRGLCAPLSFRIELPRCNNVVTEALTDGQVRALFKACDEYPNRTAADIMRLALLTGLRRGEIVRLRWEDVDFGRGFLFLRDPKGGRTENVPLSPVARAILETRPRVEEIVFPYASSHLYPHWRRIREIAGLPKDFRPLHGLRHTFASMLASSGQVDLYTLQKLLTHKSPLMTQRYAHSRDESLRKASALAGNIIEEAIMAKDQKSEVTRA